MEEAELSKDFFFQLPSAIAFIGSSRSGKTYLLLKMLENLPEITSNCLPISKFVIAYGHYQDIYQQMIQAVKKLYPDVEVQLYNSYPHEEFSSREFWRVPIGTQLFCVVDDLAEEVQPSFSKLLRGTLHHNNATLCYLTQCISGECQEVKKALKNVQYYILTRSSHSGLVLTDLNRKLFTYNPRFLMAAYQAIMSREKYAYMVIDLTVDCDNKNRIKSGLFPSEDAYIYRSG